MAIEAGGYQEFTVRTIRTGFGRIRGGKNGWPMVLLRPHGKSAKSVYFVLPVYMHARPYWWAYDGKLWASRAEAAKEANADLKGIPG